LSSSSSPACGGVSARLIKFISEFFALFLVKFARIVENIFVFAVFVFVTDVAVV
jgi:hypothetical protein